MYGSQGASSSITVGGGGGGGGGGLLPGQPAPSGTIASSFGVRGSAARRGLALEQAAAAATATATNPDRRARTMASVHYRMRNRGRCGRHCHSGASWRSTTIAELGELLGQNGGAHAGCEQASDASGGASFDASSSTHAAHEASQHQEAADD